MQLSRRVIFLIQLVAIVLSVALLRGQQVTITLTEPDGSVRTFDGVETTVPPLVISCPADLSAVASASTGLAVTYPAPTATGGKAPVAVSSQPASGTVFQVGATLVMATATSADGQMQACAFTVTVSYTAPPPPPPPPSTGTHAYYDSLRAQYPTARTYSLRVSQANLDSYRKGSTGASAVTLDPVMDAAKVVIPDGLNSLTIAQQLILPVGSAVGQTTAITWDAQYDASMAYANTGITTHKTFNTLRDSRRIWLETRNRWSLALAGTISKFDLRSYLPAIAPMGAIPGSDFYPRANTWVRYWQFFTQPVSGQAVVAVWVADAQTPARQILASTTLSLPLDVIEHLNLEFNTSETPIKANRVPPTSWVRNVVVVKNPAGMTPATLATVSPQAGL